LARIRIVEDTAKVYTRIRRKRNPPRHSAQGLPAARQRPGVLVLIPVLSVRTVTASLPMC